MTENWALGMILVLAAGLLQGTFMLPTKYTRKWNWENMWLSFSSMAYLLFPWCIALLTVPQLKQILGETSEATLARALLFGFGWGLGCLTFGLGIDCLGLALGFAIILGLTASIGSLVPLLVLSPEKVASPQGMLIVTGLVVTLVGISVCAWAGKQRESVLRTDPQGQASSPRKSYALGLVLCILSGVLSACGNLGFAFGSEMTQVAIRWRTPEQFASIPLWAVIMLPLFVCNVSFSLYLLIRNRSFAKFQLPRTNHYHFLTASMGLMWLIGMLVYGVGANKLGRIGPSVGWAALMSSVVIVANLWGVLTGEWRGTGTRPVRTMSAGLLILLVAIFIIGLSNK